MVERMKSESPDFFKKLRKIFMYLCLVFMIIVALNKYNLLPIGSEHIENMNAFLEYVTTFLFGATLTTTFTTKDQELSKEN